MDPAAFPEHVTRTVVTTTWYVPNYVIQMDHKVFSIREEKHYTKYRNRLSNELARKVLDMQDD